MTGTIGIPARASSRRADIRWGLHWGTRYGWFYGALLLLVALFGDREIVRGSGWSDWGVICGYVAACIGIGGIAGALRPFLRSRIGTVAVGALVGFLIGGTFGLLLMGPDFRNPGYLFVVPLLTCAGAGGALVIRAAHG